MHIVTKSGKIDLLFENDTKKLANIISKKIKIGDIIYLYGEIGVGKTTFIKYLINKLQKNDMNKISEIPSPTFNILNEYKLKNFTIHHYDLYRLKNKQEINDLELIENANNSITLIEWPQIIEEKPKNLRYIKTNQLFVNIFFVADEHIYT